MAESNSLEDNKPENQNEITPVFSDEEIRNTVKGFILAFIRKEITINLLAFKEAKATILFRKVVDAKKETPEDKINDIKEELRIGGKKNREFLALLEICSGIKESTDLELKTAFRQLFKEILRLRFAKRIEGTFWDFPLEQRLEKIEKKVQVDMELLKKEIRWLKEQLHV